MIETNLYKDRSYTGCLHAAFELICAKLGSIISITWSYAIMFSVGVGLFLFFQNIFGKILSVCVIIISIILIKTNFLSLVNDKHFKHNLKYSATIVIFNILLLVFSLIITLFIIFSIMALSGKGFVPSNTFGYTVYLAVFFIAGCLMLGFSMPLVYSEMKYMVESNDSLLSIIKKSYKYGLKNWAFLTIVYILSNIILIMLSFILCLPFIVMLMAVHTNTLGILSGDISALPDNFYILKFGVCLLSSFIFVYLTTWYILVFYYAYGRVESRVKVKAIMDSKIVKI